VISEYEMKFRITQDLKWVATGHDQRSIEGISISLCGGAESPWPLQASIWTVQRGGLKMGFGFAFEAYANTEEPAIIKDV